MKRSILLLAALLVSLPALADRGVTSDEVLVGSVNDLSGPFSAFGAPAVAAAQLHFNAVNEAGGIHGRTIRFIVEDSGYQMPKAMQGYNKLVNRDSVFAMLLSIGTPMNLAGFELTTVNNIPNVTPLSGSRQMLNEPVRLRFAGGTFYHDEIVQASRHLADDLGLARACAMIIPTDFGLEIQQALQEEAADNEALDYVTETTHKPDETDFVGSLQKLAAEGCDLVGVALGVRQVITVLGTTKKLGLDNMVFLGSSASFHSVIAQVPGGITNGLYAAAGWTDLAARAEEEEPAAFIAAYMDAYGEFPGTGALIGAYAARNFTMALEAAGPDLTVDSFIAAMESLDYHDPLLDNRVDYSADDHQGAGSVILSVVEDGAWKEVARFD